MRRAAEGSENTMPFILDCVRAYATLGEICDAFRDVFGTYTETSVYSSSCFTAALYSGCREAVSA